MKVTAPCLLTLAAAPAATAFVTPANAFRAPSSAVGQRGSSSSSGVASQQGVCQMMAGGRVPFIAGNWKMNPLDLATAKDLAKQVRAARRCCLCVCRV